MKASECKCCVCNKQAVAFWPVIDPDIPSLPYCRKCLTKAKTEMAERLYKDDKEMLAYAKFMIKYESYGKDNREEGGADSAGQMP